MLKVTKCGACRKSTIPDPTREGGLIRAGIRVSPHCHSLKLI